MLKQILCWSLLIGQLYAGEHPRTPLPGELNASEVNEWPTFEMVDNEDSDFTNVIFSDFEDKNEAGLAPVPEVPVAKGGGAPTPEAQAVRKMSRASKFTEAEDAGILQYVQAHPGRQNWKNCLEWLTEQGIIAPGARTARQLADRYNRFLRCRHELAAVNVTNYAPRFTAEEDEALLQIVQENPKLNWEDTAKLFAEKGVSDPAVQRSAMQLRARYNKNLKGADDRGKGPSKFTAEEDEALLQIVQEHSELSWEERANLFAEKGVSSQGVQRTASQLKVRYNGSLKVADERKNYAPRFTEAEDAGILQYVQDYPGRQNWDACLECLTEQGIIAPGSRTAAQLSRRYNSSLKAADERKNYAPRFTEAEDAGILQYVQDHPGRQNWDACLEWLSEQGIIAPGSRTVMQIKDKYRHDLKNRPEFAAVSHSENAPRFTEAEDAGIMQYVQAHPGRQNWDACLEWLSEQGIIAPGARTTTQLNARYNGSLKTADERKKLAPRFTEAEDAGITQYVQEHPGQRNWVGCLKWLTEQGIIAPGARTARQLCDRYNGYLKPRFENPSSNSVSVAPSAVQAPEASEVNSNGKSPKFTEAGDAGITLYVQEHPGRQNGDEGLKVLTDQDVVAPEARTAEQVSDRYPSYLKYCPEFAEVCDSGLSDDAGEEDENF